ncbi:MAG: radical SAM protein [Bacillota bacterium]
MNLSIINKCNTSCPYCFQGSYKVEGLQMMSVELVRKILDWNNCHDYIKIVGGEPTLHPDLLQIITEITGRGWYADLRSNLLMDNTLLCKLLQIPRLSFLFNIAHAYSEHRRQAEMFAANVETILNREPGAERRDAVIAVGITITAYVEKYLQGLYDILLADRQGVINYVRLGIETVSWDPAVPYTLDHHMGGIILEIVSTIRRLKHHVRINFDCAVNLCLIDPETLQQLRAYGVQPIFLECSYANPQSPFVIMPDLSVSWCEAFMYHPDLTIPDIFAYRHCAHAHNALIKMMYDFSKREPLNCRHATCAKDGCRGPCPGLNHYLKKHPLPLYAAQVLSS